MVRERPAQAGDAIREALRFDAEVMIEQMRKFVPDVKVKAEPALLHASSLKPEVIEGVDIVVIRELTSGIYFGKPQERRVVDGKREAIDTNYYNEIGRAHV